MPSRAVLFHRQKGKELFFLQQNDNYGWIMLRSHNNVHNYVEKKREHLVKNRVKKFLPLHALDYRLEYTHFTEFGQSKLLGSNSSP
jgi:hypothetical protein